MSHITIEVTDRKGQAVSFPADAGATLMQAIKDRGLPVAAICGGAKSCATCHVYVADGYVQVGTPDEDEVDLLTESDHYREGASRLSCQIKLNAELAGLKVTLAPE